MRVLIYGCSQLTHLLVPELSRSGSQVTVMDPNSECLGLLSEDPKVEVVLVIEPQMEDYLQISGISNAEVFLALSTDDHRNALMAQIAHHIFNIPSVMCRLDDPQLQQLYSGLGMKVISPTLDLLQHVRQGLQELPGG